MTGLPDAIETMDERPGSIEVWSAIKQSYQLMASGRHALVRLVAWPFAGIVMTGFLSEYLLPPSLEKISDLVTLIFLSAFAVFWHRHILLKESIYVGGAGPVLRYGLGLLKLLAVLAATVVALVVVPQLLLDGAGPSRLVLIVAGVVATYGASRFALILPAATVGGRVRMSDSWVATRGASIRFYVAVYWVSLPFSVSIKLIARASDRLSISGEVVLPLVCSVLVVLLSFLHVAVTAGFVSVVYRQAGLAPMGPDSVRARG